MFRFAWLWTLTCLPLSLSYSLAEPFSLTQISDRFPSQGFEDQVAFWRAVFSQYGEKEVVLHDEHDLRLIYEVVEFDKQAGQSKAEARRQRRLLRARKSGLQAAMDRLWIHGSESKNLDRTQQRILKVLKSAGLEPSHDLFGRLRKGIHAQRGVKEKFREGIVRSGRYLDTMEAIFERNGLPKELALLPHVESSFNYSSRSRRGAAGIWQFMRRTGRAYNLRVDRSIDQRRDPIAATEAAARYLQDSYRELGNWPLAVTSYNHGQRGIARAKRLHGPELLEIIARYKSRSFRYASRNFYAEFLAAVEVSKNYQTYFGPLAIAQPLEYEEVFLHKDFRINSINKIEGLSLKVLREYNPQFNNYVWNRSRFLPAGFKIRVPLGKAEGVRLASERTRPPAMAPVSTEQRAGSYRVRRGDSLGAIAKRLGTSVGAIQQLNGLTGTRIHPGQVLKIPDTRQATAGRKTSTRRRSAESSPSATQYRVKHGDSLIILAKRFGTSVGAIQQVNDLAGSRIYAGQVLKLPQKLQMPEREPEATRKSLVQSEKQIRRSESDGPRPSLYRVKRGDSLIAIARRFQTSVGEIQLANRLSGSRIVAGQVLKIPAETGPAGGNRVVRTASSSGVKSVPPALANGQYRIRRGDSLITIAQKFGISLSRLKKANGLTSHLIHPGQTLIIPIELESSR